jgi:hypothetical protein
MRTGLPCRNLVNLREIFGSVLSLGFALSAWGVHVKGSVFDMKFYSKSLIVSFDSNNVVTDVEYLSSGEK